MAEQERVAEEARQANLALLRAARTRSERAHAREIMETSRPSPTEVAEDSNAQERVEEATEDVADEGGDGEEGQGGVDTSSEAKKTTGDEEDDSVEDEEDAEEEKVASGEGEEGEVEEDEVETEPTRKRRQGKKRTVSDVEEEELVQVPVFKAHHDSWASLEQSLKEYMEATRQKIVVKEVINVARRNADLRRQVRYQGLPDSELPLVPAEMEPYQRKFICTHGWSERDRSTGKRTSHKLSTTDCPFQMLAQATKRSDGQWGVVMKREVYAHNHRVSEDIYRSYPGIRQVPADSPLMSGIELLVESEAGTTSVYNYIRENSKHRVSMDDVHNLLRRLRKQGKCLV